jgi:ribosomal protein S12 methylthiotransferase accessory factor
MPEVAAGLAKGYVAGTHRLIAPSDTIARVVAHLEALEITRLADVSGLDRLGIPVFCAIRPKGLILQSTNGKGLRPDDARASALMEAVEHHHAERPIDTVRASWRQVVSGAGVTPQGRATNGVATRCVVDTIRRPVAPQTLPQYRAGTYWSDDFVIDWAAARDLMTGEPVWLPASAVYSGASPCLHDFATNGLASGNHRVEAILHGLYEVIERNAVSRLSVDGKIRIAPPACQVIDPESLTGVSGSLYARVRDANVDLRLISVRSSGEVPTFWAALLDRAPFSESSTVNVGYGTHLSPTVAAVRAITEAAQSRLCYIHGAREDLAAKMAGHSTMRLKLILNWFDRLRPDARWESVADGSTGDLQADLDRLLERLRGGGVEHVYMSDLTREPFDIPVVRVVVPGMTINRRFF